MRGRRRSAVLLALAAAVSVVATACTDDDAPTPAKPTVTRVAKPAELTFGVWGSPEELAAYQRVVDSYDAGTDTSNVTLTTFPDAATLTAAVEAGDGPDVFLLPRTDLAAVEAVRRTRPLGALLDERGVDFGDGYSRAALGAFSDDRDLQCMPYGVSPDVVYYNKRWVDFDKMIARDLPAPALDPDDLRKAPRWSFDQFTAAAQFATKPRRGIRGLYVDPTLRGLAPFLYAGGGTLYDDDRAPTSLALADGSSRDALRAVLPTLRDAQLTLTADQLAQASALQWFKRGKLGMIVGSRDLVPELRAVPGLDFDVMPIPTGDDSATVGDLTGLCLSSAKRTDTDAGADFLVHATSTDAVREVALAGRLAPANQTVALSDGYLQPGLLPLHSSVFVAALRDLRIDPLIVDDAQLSAAVATDVNQLFTTPLLDPDLETITQNIDDESRLVLDPTAPTPTPSFTTPSSDPTQSPSPSASPSG